MNSTSRHSIQSSTTSRWFCYPNGFEIQQFIPIDLNMVLYPNQGGGHTSLDVSEGSPREGSAHLHLANTSALPALSRGV